MNIIKCECGSECSKLNKARHERTQKHQAYLKSLEDNKNDNAI